MIVNNILFCGPERILFVGCGLERFIYGQIKATLNMTVCMCRPNLSRLVVPVGFWDTFKGSIQDFVKTLQQNKA